MATITRRKETTKTTTAQTTTREGEWNSWSSYRPTIPRSFAEWESAEEEEETEKEKRRERENVSLKILILISCKWMEQQTEGGQERGRCIRKVES